MKKGILTLLFPLLLSATGMDKEDYEFAYSEGKRIYNQTCVSCHGRDGTARTSLNLVVRPRDLTKTILSEDQIYKTIRDGARVWGSKSDIMPSFKSVYSDEELRNTALFIFDTFTKKQFNNSTKLLAEAESKKELSLKRGKKIYKRNCSLCHGLNGDGNSEYVEKSKGNKNLIYPYNLQKVQLNEDQIFLYAKFGGKFWGTYKKDMPAWGKKYDDHTLRSVSKYIVEELKKQ